MLDHFLRQQVIVSRSFDTDYIAFSLFSDREEWVREKRKRKEKEVTNRRGPNCFLITHTHTHTDCGWKKKRKQGDSKEEWNGGEKW